MKQGVHKEAEEALEHELRHSRQAEGLKGQAKQGNTLGARGSGNAGDRTNFGAPRCKIRVGAGSSMRGSESEGFVFGA